MIQSHRSQSSSPFERSPPLLPRTTLSFIRLMSRPASSMVRSRGQSSWSSQRALSKGRTWYGSSTVRCMDLSRHLEHGTVSSTRPPRHSASLGRSQTTPSMFEALVRTSSWCVSMWMTSPLLPPERALSRISRTRCRSGMI
jgi:hypothetical protein